jgi:flagellin
METAIGIQETNSAEGAGSNVASIDISTAAGAQKAIDTIDSALEQINSTRGDLGAVSNRLDFTVNNLSNVAENVSAARSQIQDADFAAESANLSRAQVLQQAGTAMLAQANASSQNVLSLLQ